MTHTKVSDFFPDRGHYTLVRVDGSVEHGEFPKGKLILDVVYNLIGCQAIDAVLLDRSREVVMLVDDEGLLNGSKVNLLATRLYQATHQTMNPIAGVAVICCDKDFE